MEIPKMRRKDREMPLEEALAILRAGEYGVLASHSDSTGGYATPLSYILRENALYFHCARKGHKLDNLRQDPRVCFCVVGKTQPIYSENFTTLYESVLVFGAAAFVENKEEKEEILRALCQKYLPDHMDKAADAIVGSLSATQVIRVDISQVTGKAKR